MVKIVVLDPKLHAAMIKLHGEHLTLEKLSETDPYKLIALKGIGALSLDNLDKALREHGIKWLEQNGFTNGNEVLKSFVSMEKSKVSKKSHRTHRNTRLANILQVLTRKRNPTINDLKKIKLADLLSTPGAGITVITVFDNLMKSKGINWLNEQGIDSPKTLSRIMRKIQYYRYTVAKYDNERLDAYIKKLLP